MAIPSGFPGLTTSALEEAQRIFRQQDELMRHLRPMHDIQGQIEAALGPINQYEQLRRSAFLDTAYELANTHADDFKRVQNLIRPHWSDTVRETALALQQFDTGATAQMQILSSGLGSDLETIAKSLNDHRSILEASMAAMPWRELNESLLERLSPTLMQLEAVARSVYSLEFATLRASSFDTPRPAQLLAEDALDIHRLALELMQTEAPDKHADRFAALFRRTAMALGRFKDNTVKEITSIGMIRVFEIASVIVTLCVAFLPAEPRELAEKDRAEVAAIRAELSEVNGKLQEMLAKLAASEESFVADLPRAALKLRAIIRSKAEWKAPTLLKVRQVMPVAIADRRGGWFQVVYRDPLSLQLAKGWVQAQWIERDH